MNKKHFESHDTGDVVAYWFGSREHENLDRLIELEIGKVYSDGNYAYFKHFSNGTSCCNQEKHTEDRAKTFIIEDLVCKIGS